MQPGIQQSLDHLWPCDCCNGEGTTTDPENLVFVRLIGCVVCHGTGLLDYEPPPGSNPFEGMETQ